jgi:hypothetical protein
MAPAGGAGEISRDQLDGHLETMKTNINAHVSVVGT